MSDIQANCLWKKRKIERLQDGERFLYDEILIKEETYRLVINGETRTEFACSPGDLEELAAGYAFTSGLIQSRMEIKGLCVKKHTKEIHMEIKPIKAAQTEYSSEGMRITSASVYEIWKQFDSNCLNFKQTGAAHAVALVDTGSILILKEDVARYNVLLKVLGSAILHDITLKDKGMFFSGRMAAQMVQMIRKTEIQVLLCHGAATLGAVEAAREANLTLAGFVKNQYMNIYTGGHRII